MSNTEALRQRLADEADLCRNDGANDIAALLDEARAALAQQPAASGEPVATHTQMMDHLESLKTDPAILARLCAATPHPAPARVPLTDERLDSLIEKNLRSYWSYGAVEQDKLRRAVREIIRAAAQVDTTPAVQAQPVALTQALIREMTDDTREVFDASGSETPQVVRDVIEYVASWLQVYAEKRAAAQGGEHV